MKEKRQKVLNEALKLVPFNGWTDDILINSVKSANLDASYAQILFDHKVVNLVELFINNIEEKAISLIDKKHLDDLSIRNRISYCVKAYLEAANIHKQAIRKTIVFYISPTRFFDAFKSLWNITDHIWHVSGDRATDLNHYSKRAILSVVYSSTLLYWLNDKSDNHINSWEFLDRRIENVMQIEKCKNKAKNLLNKIKK